nr:glycosyltransferase family 4 protein [uncultured Marinifilum sp.]
MKVLHLTNNYPTKKYPISGIFVKEQIDSLEDIGIDTEVYLVNGRENGKLEYLKEIFRIRRFLKNRQFDVIHCHHALTALTLILSGKAKKSKVVVSFQNDPTHEFGLKLFSFIQKRTDAWIFKNNSSLISSSNHYYLPNGVNTGFFQPIDKKEACKKLGLDEGKRYLLFVSSNFMREQKRYDIFTEVLRILREKHGLNDLEELKLINTKRELVPYYFNAASVHLLSSDFEGSPNSVKEAMACETPVVSTNVGNVEELLEKVNSSYVAEANDPEELASLVLQSLNKPENNSREILIQKKLDIVSVAKKLQDLYASLIN